MDEKIIHGLAMIVDHRAFHRQSFESDREWTGRKASATERAARILAFLADRGLLARSPGRR